MMRAKYLMLGTIFVCYVFLAVFFSNQILKLETSSLYQDLPSKWWTDLIVKLEPIPTNPENQVKEVIEANATAVFAREEVNTFVRGTVTSEKRLAAWSQYVKENRASSNQTYFVSQDWLVDQMDEAYEDFFPYYTERLQVILKTDKEIYRPNDVIFIEAIVLNALNKTPVAIDPSTEFFYNYYSTLEILDPTESIIFTDYQYAQNTSASFSFKVPATASGGQYVVKVGSYNMPTARKVIRVQDYARPQLQIVVSLDQDSYFPGAVVNGQISAQTIDGSAFSEQPVFSYSANFEGQVRSEQGVTMSQGGKGSFSFTIPEQTSLLFATIAFEVTAGAVREASAKTLVISNPDQIVVDFFPETGFFVAEVTNKVYFAAYINEERYDVVDFKQGKLIETNPEGKNVLVSDIQTSHKGKGFFEFVPNRLDTCQYHLEFTESNSQKTIKKAISTIGHSLNEVTFRVTNPNKVLRNSEDLTIEVLSNSLADEDSAYMLSLSVKEQILFSQQFSLESDKETIVIGSDQISVKNGGVLQVNLHKLSDDIIAYSEYLNYYSHKLDNQVDVEQVHRGWARPPGGLQKVENPKDKKPEPPKKISYLSEDLIQPNATRPAIDCWRIFKGELLVFKVPEETLKLEVATNKDKYRPGELVEFEVGLEDYDGDEEVLVSVVVTDESVFQRLEEKLQPPTFASAVYLAYDVLNYNHHFHYANYYIEHIFGCKMAEHSNDLNLELLLGIQNWRMGIFDLAKLEEIRVKYEQMDDDEKAKINNLFGMEFGPEIMYAMAEMAFAEDEEMMMDMAVMEANAPMMRKNIVPQANNLETKTAAAPTAAPESEEEGEGEGDDGGSSVSQGESSVGEIPRDFMVGIPANTKYWAHQLREGYDSSLRVDKTETQFYTTFTKIGKDKKFKGSFYLSDLITEFRITVNAIDAKGRIGYSYSSIQTQLPFYLNFEMPPSLTVGDTLVIPITVKNIGDETLKYQLKVEHCPDMDVNTTSLLDEYSISPNSTATNEVQIIATKHSCAPYLFITGTAQGAQSGQSLKDSYISYTSVVPKGFPKKFNQGGFIGTTLTQDQVPSSVFYQIQLPQSMEEGTFNLEVKVMTSNLASLLEAVQSLIGTPCGCFEQTSATSYPMVMGLDFLQAFPEQTQEVQGMQAEILAKLKPAYQKLTTFQTKENGYEWFGESPSHEALTAYGLMQFKDMQKVADFVDDGMVQETKAWLMSRKNAKGGFDLSSVAIDSFGRAPEEINNVYIVWALVSSGQAEGLEDQITELKKKADESIASNSADPYKLGLLSSILYQLGEASAAQTYADVVTKFQQSYGNVTDAETSVTSSRGSNLVIETTSIAVLAWLNDQTRYSNNIKSAVEWIVTKVRKGGSYGSTQATILALKALKKYMEDFVDINGKGEFVLKVNEVDAEVVPFSEETKEGIKFDLTGYVKTHQELFSAGKEVLFELSIRNFERDPNSNQDFQLAYSIEASYYDQTPETAQSDLHFQVSKRFESSALGSPSFQSQAFSYKVTLENLNANSPSGMVVAIFRLPSCLEINYQLLDTLLGNGMFDLYEVASASTEIVMYFRNFRSLEKKEFEISLLQKYEGTCYEKPHNAYMYYNDDFVVWVATE